MKKLFISLCAAMVLGIASQANAVVLSLTPSSQVAGNGDTVFLDLVIDGLTAGGPDSLGDFDVDVVFDDSVLTFQNYALGSFLGDDLLGEAIDFSFGDLGGGLVNIAELSLLDADPFSGPSFFGPYLDDIQPGSFSLATLEFTVDALSPGSSTVVDLFVNAVGDGYGQALPLDGTDNAVIRARSIATPAPAVLALLGIGLFGIGIVRVYRK